MTTLIWMVTFLKQKTTSCYHNRKTFDVNRFQLRVVSESTRVSWLTPPSRSNIKSKLNKCLTFYFICNYLQNSREFSKISIHFVSNTLPFISINYIIARNNKQSNDQIISENKDSRNENTTSL